ncbi:MAG: flavin reductase family protein [Lentisphaerae bacterium]|jgi:flavin reductase (DIM6/NTAB) family NADH-FMN oxidoreductase RutF|nr:flavin reductase family protein [Lentisphaerota bacterium]MBT4816211.1 flavin reductase family protein [Lentisphaerota bacterium]MBT5610312.1 flavin reductase family protein [Lentisphaerota bacterium]MBT7056397.1 flavin reductase family protein [Lentisphaerota bacterium]MBT7848231.1 flavin reductase family protein [Lentisphaerota bacterium]
MDRQIAFPGDPGFASFYPGSVVMVSAVDAAGKADICTVGAWALVNGAPRLFGIAMCTTTHGASYWKRYTTTCIDETGEFVINIPDLSLRDAWMACGSVSLVREPEADKFALSGLTPAVAAVVNAPLIAECPVSIECRVHSRLALPTHDWIVGEPVAVHTADRVASGDLTLTWENAPALSES